MKKKSIGITGSSGSLGRELLNIKKYKFIRYKDDIRSKKKLKNWFDKNNFDAIIHLAAIVPIKNVNSNKKKAYDVNYVGTKNIVDLSLKKKINWFFFASTSHVYNSNKNIISEESKCLPISYYGKTKYLAEKYITSKSKSKINFCIGRIFSTTNKNQKKSYLVPDLKKKIKKNYKNIVLANLNHYRDFISMKDISKIILYLYNIQFKGIINLGSGKKINLKKIAKIIAKKYKKSVSFKDNKITTYLVADNSKLKKIYKYKINSKIEKMIF